MAPEAGVAVVGFRWIVGPGNGDYAAFQPGSSSAMSPERLRQELRAGAKRRRN
jgi:hypothetical protein